MVAKLRSALRAHAGGLPPVFWWLWTGELLSSLATFVFPFLALFLADRRLSTPLVGLLASCLGAGRLAAAPVSGALADRWGRRPVLLVALTGSALSACALAVLDGAPAIAGGVFVFGALSTAVRAPIQAIVADVVPGPSAARAMGLLYWARNLGIGVSGLLGGVLARYGWSVPFLADGLTTLAFAALAWWKVPETRPAAGAMEERPAPGWAAVAHDGRFLVLLAATFLVVLVFWQHQTALPLDMARRGLTPVTFGLVLVVNTALIVLLQPVAARALDGHPPALVLAGASVAVGLGLAACAFCSSFPAYAGAGALWTVGEIGFFPIASALSARLAPPALRGRYAGAHALAGAAGMTVAPVAGTALLDLAGARTLWFACLGLALGVAAALLAVGRRLGGDPHLRCAT